MDSVSEQRVDFFIIGVQKGGTSALHRYLMAHPRIEMPASKELHHFDDESIDWSNPNHAAFHSRFDWSDPCQIRGEATPIYIYWPHAMERLRRYNPDAKLIIGLRHPTFRAYSHWRMECARGDDRLTFEDAVSPKGRARVAAAPHGAHRVYSYIERGFYAGQIARLLTHFSRNRMYFFRTDHLWLETQTTLAGIESFLGLDHVVSAGAQAKYVVPLDSRATAQMSSRVRNSLNRLFCDDLRRTEELTGLSLSDWFDPAYAEPMEAPDKT